MAKVSYLTLNKLIEAAKLHKRTGLPLGEPPATIPYGALIEYKGADRDLEKFTYLGELYGCNRDVFQSATGGGKSTTEEETTATAKTAAPARESQPEAEPESRGPRLNWDRVDSSGHSVWRTSIPGGWLVTVGGSSVTFVPDPNHQWDGGSAE